MSAASGESLSPWWHLSSSARPTYLPPGGNGHVIATVVNVGDAATAGEVTIVDKLPAGVIPVSIEGAAGISPAVPTGVGPVECSLATLTCTFAGELAPYTLIEIDIEVHVEADASTGEENVVSVSGGGARRLSLARPLTISTAPTPLGVQDFQFTAEEAGGGSDTDAGSHPFQLTSAVTLNQTPEAQPAQLPRRLSVSLPPGLLGNPTGFAECAVSQFTQEDCPAGSVLGVAMATAYESLDFGEGNHVGTFTVPIVNLEPLRGEAARFGVSIGGAGTVYLSATVRSGTEYGLTLNSSELSESTGLLNLNLALWGVPGDQRHNSAREQVGFGGTLQESEPAPFVSLPTSCGDQLQSTIAGNSWLEPETGELEPLASAPLSPLDSCNRLGFEPSIGTSPDMQDASTPSGLNVDLHVPQEGSLDAAGVVPSNLEDIAVTLPRGMTINPAGANQLEACTESEVGFTGSHEFLPDIPTRTFTPRLPGSVDALAAGESEPLQPGVNFCPNASKIGTVEMGTPLLGSAQRLQGGVYLATPNANPFGSLLALYLIAEDPISGTVVKLAGELSLNPATGQITVAIENTPDLPIEDIDLHFLDGERALLGTPSHCGTYTTEALLTPWSGGEPAVRYSSFEIGTGANGTSCTYAGQALPFSPTLTGGSTNLEAGSFSPLTVTIGRQDGEQSLQGLQLRLPAGLSAMLANVPLCLEQQANEGTCSSASEIGETTVSAGLGTAPYTLSGGKVYLTGPYSGTGTCVPGGTQPSSSSCAPFGLSIEVPVKAGPLDLEGTPENHPGCDCLVIRAKIEVDPQTAQLTIVTGGIPNIIDGIPLQIKDLNITIDRQGFIFNPTNCAHLPLTGTISGNEGAIASVSSPFQVANCGNLKFSPKLTASTEGHAEALKGGAGASLSVRIATKGGAGVSGEEANIKRVDLTLPRLLPARLQPTLQHACTRAQFAKNPAGCPPDSFVGTATAVTPMLGGVPGGGLGGVAGGGLGGKLVGPAIFVSRGGAALPDLDLVLQGDGTLIVLTGGTEIKGEVTYAKFEAFPDVPISSFALSLPEGPHSALASGLPTNKHSLCGQSLQMPATIEGQNGAVVKQVTKVRVEGCKHKKPKHRKRPKKNRHDG